MQVLAVEVVFVGSGERRGAFQDLVREDAQGVDVAGACRAVALPTFGGHVGKGAGELVGLLRGSRVGVTGDAEVGQAPATVEEQDVLRLEVTVHDSAVQVGQGLGNVGQHFHGFCDAQRAVLLEVGTQ